MKILPVLGRRQRKARGEYGFLVDGPPLLQGRRVKEVTGVPLWGLGSSTALGQGSRRQSATRFAHVCRDCYAPYSVAAKPRCPLRSALPEFLFVLSSFPDTGILYLYLVCANQQMCNVRP